MPVRITLPATVLGLSCMPIPVVDLGPILANSATGPGAAERRAGPSDASAGAVPGAAGDPLLRRTELRVRVYPDKVHLDSHDPALNADEVLWGGRFWELQWADASKQREAWRMLAGPVRPGARARGWRAR